MVKIFTTYPPPGYPREKNLEDSSLNIIRSFSPDPLHLMPSRISTPGMGRRDYFSFPDNKVSWLPNLKRSLESMDVVVTTCPPFSLLLSGFSIRNIPWIIDFRDPWTGGYLGKYTFKWEEKLAMTLERYSIEQASACVTVTRNHLEYLKSRYPEHSREFYLVRNGYNEESFPKIPKRVRDNDIMITYMGTFNNLITPDYIFEGLRELFKIKPGIKNRIVFKHIGHSSGGGLDRRAKKVGLNRFIPTGYLPHQKALIELFDSDILILLGTQVEQDNEIIPGKLYEYLRSRIPIVAVTTNKEIEELIGSQGICCGFNPDEIAEGILEVIQNQDSFTTVRNYRNYSWVNHAKEYSKLLLSVL